LLDLYGITTEILIFRAFFLLQYFIAYSDKAVGLKSIVENINHGTLQPSFGLNNFRFKSEIRDLNKVSNNRNYKSVRAEISDFIISL